MSGKEMSYAEGVNINERRLVLIGKTGLGKSATGNTILGKQDAFKSKMSLSSVTTACKQGEASRFGKKILVVDTPGLFDTVVSNDEIALEIGKCVGISSPGPHAFILVIQIGQRFTEEEEKSVKRLEDQFGEALFRYLIVLFTGKDKLCDMPLKEYLEGATKGLQIILKKCQYRVITFNNMSDQEGKKQDTEALLEIIEKLLVENNGSFYTNEMYVEAEKFMLRKMEELKEAKENEKKKEINKIQKEIASRYEQRIVQFEKKKEESEDKMKLLLDEKEKAEKARKKMEEEQKAQKIKDQALLQKQREQLEAEHAAMKNAQRKIEEEKEKIKQAEAERQKLSERQHEECISEVKKVKEAFDTSQDEFRKKARIYAENNGISEESSGSRCAIL